MNHDPEQGWRWVAYLAGRCLVNLPRAIRHPEAVVDALINLEREAVWPAEIRGPGRGSLTVGERLFLRWLCVTLHPTTAFEFGTGQGWTTQLLAEYASRVWSLDHSDIAVGAPHITCLTGDSRSFDFSQYESQMDLIFVDGGHDAATVRSDSLAAERLRSPRGVIVWHDCNVQHRDVWRFLRDRRWWDGTPLLRVDGTRLVVDLGPSWTHALP